MALKRYRTKQPYEEYYLVFDFADWLGTATISSATVTAVNNSTGVDVTATITTVGSQAKTNTEVKVWVKAGTSGETYKITVKAVASDGSKYEKDGLLPVLES